MRISLTSGPACSKYILSFASNRPVAASNLHHTHLRLSAPKLVPALQRSSFVTTSSLFQSVTNPSEDPRASSSSSSSPSPSSSSSNNNTNPSIPVTSGSQIRRLAHNNQAKATSSSRPQDLTLGLDDAPLTPDENGGGGGEKQVDWSRSFHGLSSIAFPPEAVKILNEPLDAEDIEVKPDGLLYLPEIKYRRILNRAFGPGAWGLAPRGPTIVTAKTVTREYGMVVQGRLVSIARGEQQYFDAENIPTATEGCKSNVLMRCCKDLGIASELWDPRFIRKFIAENVREVWVEHASTGKRRKVFLRNGEKVQYPYKEAGTINSSAGVRSGASAGRSVGQKK